MLEKIKEFQDSLKINQNFSDIKINIQDFHKNFCYHSFIQHSFSKLIVIVQISFICNLDNLKNNGNKEFYFINNIIIFCIGFLSWKIFSAFFEYLDEVSLIKYIKFMNKKEYFFLGIFYRKIILLSFLFLLLFFFPYIFLFQKTMNNLIKNKSLAIEDFLSSKNYNPYLNSTADGNARIFILKDFEQYNKNYLKNEFFESVNNITLQNKMEIKDNNKNNYPTSSNISITNKSFSSTHHPKKSNITFEIEIKENFENKTYFLTLFEILNFYQYIYFAILLIKIINKPIQNIFFVFRYHRYLNFNLVIKFFSNVIVCKILLSYKYNFLFAIFFADFISELFSFIFLICIINIYNPFPQVWIIPSVGIFSIDWGLFKKTLDWKKIIKFFFVNFWNDFLFLIFIVVKINNFNYKKTYEENKIKTGLEENDIFYLEQTSYKSITEFIKYININFNNFFLFIVLKEFFFNISKYTKRNSFKEFLEKFDLISIIKKQKVSEKNKIKIDNCIRLNDPKYIVNSLDTNIEANQLLLERDEKDISLVEKKNSDDNTKCKIPKRTNINIDSSLNSERPMIITNSSINKNNNDFVIERNIKHHLNETINNQKTNNNILVKMKMKIVDTLVISGFLFILILIFKVFGIFDLFFNSNGDYFEIGYFFILILFIFGTLNYVANELFIINDFLENPNYNQMIILSFCFFSFIPFLIVVFLITNSISLLIVINSVNIYFIYTFYDFLSNIDLRFKKFDLLINKQIYEI